MSTWFTRNLGDALLAEEALDRIQTLFRSEYGHSVPASSGASADRWSARTRSMIPGTGGSESLTRAGRVEWIGVRPARDQPMVPLGVVQLNPGQGLEGDRFRSGAGNPRQVTLIEQEHLSAIGACLHSDPVPPELLRRNIAVSGLNLLALKGKSFHIGDALPGIHRAVSSLQPDGTPVGPGGYSAMRGHGGITA